MGIYHYKDRDMGRYMRYMGYMLGPVAMATGPNIYKYLTGVRYNHKQSKKRVIGTYIMIKRELYIHIYTYILYMFRLRIIGKYITIHIEII